MKTLVVFSALVSITIAAPALQEGKLENTKVPDHQIQEHPRIPELVKTEQKSTLEQPTSTLNTAALNPEFQNEDGGATVTGKSYLMRPLIVKRKSGLTFFRNSEEEKAESDPNETCGRQVKVKLCDENGKLKEMLKSSTHDVTNGLSADDDMKLSIMMAKEAVESLQRDLKNMENKNSALKMAHDTETDAALHEDIEVARKALEHVQTNFDHLDTMRLHAALRDSQSMHDVHITLAKSEEEKMAQWKEALNNIQRNVEIASNIEDSFKALNDQDSHVALHEEQNIRDAEKSHLNEQTEEKKVANSIKDTNPSASEVSEMKTVDIANSQTLMSENHKRQEHNLEDKVTEKHKEAAVNTKNIEVDNQLAKTSESEVKVPKSMASNKQQQPFSVKEAEDAIGKLDLDKKWEFKTSENFPDTNTASSTNSVNILAPLLMSEHQRNTMENEFDKMPGKQMPLTGLHMKSVEFTKGDKNMHDQTKPGVVMEKAALRSEMHHHSKMFEMKPKDATQTSFLQVGDKKNKQHLSTSVQENFMKAASVEIDHKIDYNESDPLAHKQRKSDEIDLHQHFAGLKHAEDNLNNHMAAMKMFEMNPKDATQTSLLQVGDKKNKQHLSTSIQENFMKTASVEDDHRIDYNESDPLAHKQRKSDEMDLHQHFAGMKHAENHLNNHMAAMKAAHNRLHQLESRPSTSRWSNGFRNKASMKAVEELTEDFHAMDHMRSSHLSDHRFNPNKIGVTHDFDRSEHIHQHGHIPSQLHNNMMSRAKMHDSMHDRMTGGIPTHFHSNMREVMDGFGSEHSFRWMPSHESARNAYSASLSGSGSASVSAGSSGSAVGVFPNANTGGCGIPLLLSCSPSVVSGSLAKAHAAGPAQYSPPSYRAEEDFNFHNKRDIKKTYDDRGPNVLRSPSIVKQKTGTMEEIKL